MKKNRYAFLDGIRGIAAIFVLTRHTQDFWNFSLYRSYLAVDLFFILSGFVIAFSYENKLENKSISIKDFLILRMIRIYPIYILSVIICSFLLIGGTLQRNNFNIFKIGDALSVVALTIFFLPSKVIELNVLYPMNIAYWSLFFEIIANSIYALIRPILNSTILVAILFFFGLIIAVSAGMHGNLDIGFSWGWKSSGAGFSRAMFGVFLGIFLYRNISYFSKFMFKASPWLSIIIIVFVLMSPSFGKIDPIIDFIVVLFVFPVCVFWAAQDTSKKITSVLLVLGTASYPMYVFHVPIGSLVSHAAKGLPAAYAPISGIIFVFAIILLSIWLEKVYDIPIRRWLSKKFLPKIESKNR